MTGSPPDSLPSAATTAVPPATDTIAGGAPPLASVVISTRNRALRLRWLLNALEDQDCPPEQYEVIVAHDSTDAATEELLRSHPLRPAGRLRHLTFPDGELLAAGKRNAGWRAAHGSLVLFTDDDCRPSHDWVRATLAAAQRHPGTVLQGRTVPDADERATLLGAPWVHTQLIEPPTVWAETCNIAYPRAALEDLAGFREELSVGEDTDLALRAAARGLPTVAVPEMVVHHAVEERTLPAAIRAAGRWGDMALLVRLQPSLRRELWGRIWWRPEHAALALAWAGAAVVRHPLARLSLALPWAALAARHRGYGPRGILRSITELPGRGAVDSAELLALARASVRHRSLLL